ncbi:MAG TPA: Ig-like domain-containing protein [Methanoregulaceae archaeon]|nr:Ig-like domain-containing protein [Methanoregulaceae archaeon]
MAGCRILLVIALLATATLVLPSLALVSSSPGIPVLAGEEAIPLGVGSDTQETNAPDHDGTKTAGFPAPNGFPPSASDCSITTNQNTPVEITLSARDPDGDTLHWFVEAGPLHGTLGPIRGDRVVYTPLSDYAGSDSFRYKVHDGFWDSDTAMVTITIIRDCQSGDPHLFYGTVTIDGRPAPESAIVRATGEGVIQDIAGNPMTTRADGTYGSANSTPDTLAVRGCIPDGTPVMFSVNGLPAEAGDPANNSTWQPAYPFVAGGLTRLDLRVTTPPPPPDYVYITAIGISLSSPENGITKTMRLEKNPELEVTVSAGMFFIDFYAIGGHAFFGQPVLGRDATIGIYENGIPLSVEEHLWFGSSRVTYDYLANETRTFDILVFVNEEPEISTARHITITTLPSKS